MIRLDNLFRISFKYFISRTMMAQTKEVNDSIVFYHLPESPPCRTVEMVAGMVGVKLNKQRVNLAKGEHLKPEYLSVNPLGKVPYIVDGDVKMGESRAIAAYLVNKYLSPDNTLYPQDPIKRAKIDELLYLDIGYIYAAASNYYSPRLFGDAKELDPKAEEKFAKTLQFLDSLLESNGNKKFLLGDELTIADVSMAASLSFPEACGYSLDKFTSLSKYYRRLQESIPEYHQINDKPNENMRIYVGKILGTKA